MEREISFRAKGIECGEWVYGVPVKAGNTTFICYCAYAFNEDMSYHSGCSNPYYYQLFQTAVEPETIGQYTGFQDKNGIKIFENDVIYFKEENMKGLINYRYGGWYITWYGYVQVCNGIGWEEKYTECNEESLYSNCLNEEDKIPYEIIGNIHDNKELIKE